MESKGDQGPITTAAKTNGYVVDGPSLKKDSRATLQVHVRQANHAARLLSHDARSGAAPVAYAVESDPA